MLGHVGLGQPNLAALGQVQAIAAQNIDVGLLVNTQTFFAPAIANEAAQDITPILFNEGDVFYAPTVDQQALPNQILVQHFDEGDLFYAPAIALEPAQNINLVLFEDPDIFYPPQVFGEATDLFVTVAHYTNPHTFHVADFVVSGKEPVYTYPIGRGLYSDYGIRASMTNYKRRMIIGRR